MTILRYLITENQLWSLVPVSVAVNLAQKEPIDVHTITVSAPERICYAVQRRNENSEMGRYIIDLLRQTATKLDGVTLI